ncbi:MAG: glycerol-3-phosphate 1-O-acyltransferase [Alphaproteobacteria bacterium]|nr:glycerol-3-phosphate 1-O-acyltransferase PlsY [Pseudomonadota bacterium]TDI68226.1 MAG: glycerol-3-phosphate 1-O-acyltransferase [Alphaproteobacteria bacterium]
MPGSAEIWPLLGALIAGYLAGAVPFGLLLSRAMGFGDIRKMGSGNIGATNVLRTGHKGIAAATLVLDGGKGALAVLLAAAWLQDTLGQDAALLAGAGAVIGHVFPVWLRFRGGKGVATTMGVLLAVSWPTGLAVIGTWLAVAMVGRFSSLAAICAMALAPAFAWWLADPRQALLALALGVLVVVMHRTNIARLVSGEETRVTLGRGRGSTD